MAMLDDLAGISPRRPLLRRPLPQSTHPERAATA
jgi:hypothetical protein